jgi:hypothetical protein
MCVSVPQSAFTLNFSLFVLTVTKIRDKYMSINEKCGSSVDFELNKYSFMIKILNLNQLEIPA